MGVIVRRETSADVAAARAVHVAAFAKHGVSDEPVEARLLDALRDCDGWLAELTIVPRHQNRRGATISRFAP